MLSINMKCVRGVWLDLFQNLTQQGTRGPFKNKPRIMIYGTETMAGDGKEYEIQWRRGRPVPSITLYMHFLVSKKNWQHNVIFLIKNQFYLEGYRRNNHIKKDNLLTTLV